MDDHRHQPERPRHRQPSTRGPWFLALWLILHSTTGWALTVDATAQVDPNRVVGTVDERLYSQFLEHIYHSVHGGLWGERIWNRSFEEANRSGLDVRSGLIQLNARKRAQFLLLGHPQWRDYEFTVEARKRSGREGFLVLVRHRDDQTFYWLNLGGWENTRHCLEKTHPKRAERTEVGATPGSIETNRWYTIRFRCQGDHFEAWLDQLKVLDVRDPEPIDTGQVGVGVWDSEADFRRPRVTDLDGQVLLNDLPEVLPRYWKKIGEGTVRLDPNEPFNSDLALRLEGIDVGVEQSPLDLRAGQTYTGSVWARGHLRSGLLVRLMNGPSLLAEQNLPLNSDDWVELPFQLTPKGSTTYGAFQIGLGYGGTAWIDQVSLMAESDRRAGGFNAQILRPLAELRPKMLRWPGGYFVTHYRWKDAVGPQAGRRVYPTFVWDDRDTNAFGIDEFLRLCRLLKADPVVVVNSHPPTGASEQQIQALLQDTLDLIEYCNGSPESHWGRLRAENGHPEPYDVRTWELDDMVTDGHPDLAHRWIQAIKSVDPTLELAIDIPDGTGPADQALIRQTLETLGPGVSILSVEHYDDTLDYPQALPRWQTYLQMVRRLIQQCPNPNLKLYVSEWNLRTETWTAGLYAGQLLNLFETHGDLVRISSPAICMSHQSGFDHYSLIRFDQERWIATPCYLVMKLWHDFYAPLRLASTCSLDAVSLVATRDSEGRWLTVKVVNPSDDTVRLTLQGPDGSTLPARSLEGWIIAAHPTASNSFDNPRRIQPKFHRWPVGEGPSRVELPPTSVAVFRLRRP